MEPALSSRTDALIYGIHAAAGYEPRWEHVVSDLRHLFRGRVAVLACHDLAAGRGEWLFESPVNPLERQAYAVEYSVRNPWFASSLEYRPGRVMTGDDLIDAEALRRTDFYRRHLKRLGLYHRLCGVVLRREDLVYYAEVFRGRNQPPFDADDRALFGSILRHLTISLGNHQRLLSEHGENCALRSVLDRLDAAAFVVDEKGWILLANARSAEFLESFEGIEIRGGRLAAVSRAENRALLEAIAAAAESGVSAADPEAKIVTLSCPSEPYPAMVSVIPATDGRIAALNEHQPAALLIAKDPHHPNSSFDCCAFTSIFKLTPVQGQLAGLILSGHSLSGASRKLRISENTTRSHLKQVYQKTNTHSQIELVHLHARICTEHL